MHLQLFVLSSLITWIYGQPFTGCLLQVNTNKANAPLLFHNSNGYLDMVRTDYGNVRLSTDDDVTLACPGPANYLKNMPNHTSCTATCKTGAMLKMFNQNVNFNDLQCSKSIRGGVRNTTRSCANARGSIKEIGYQISATQWVTLITVCYEAATGTTFYTKHDLDGREIKYAPKNCNRPNFSVAGLEISAAVAYNKTYQKIRFNVILGSALLSDNYIDTKISFLARGHLSPCADFFLAASKRASFYYINVIPQWEVINIGNWKTVESSVRRTAERLNSTFTIITGTYGVFTLPNINRTETPIYLSGDHKLPVPLIIWKIVYDPLSGKGIAFLVINNPFFPSNSVNCTNICGSYGWGSANWSNSSKGYTYCCDVREFLKVVVNTAPNLNVSGVLNAN